MKTKHYVHIKQLGEGQYANVYKARDILNNEFVAIKKIKFRFNEKTDYIAKGVDWSSIREIKLLKEIEHENVIALRDIISVKDTLQIVMDFMETDLEKLIVDRQKTIITMAQIKNLTIQLLRGLEHLHTNWILHRDLKPSNLLLNSTGRLKIADFGMARFYGSLERDYTYNVVTLWYRAPELLFGAKSYSTGIDIWSVGCIIGELLLRNPVFPGKNEIDQLIKIAKVLGVATEENWTGVTKLPRYVKINVKPEFNLRTVFSAASNDMLELIASCFKYDPKERCTATSALEMECFKSEPFPCHDNELPGVSNVEKITANANRKRLHETDDEPGVKNKAARKLDFEAQGRTQGSRKEVAKS